MSSRRRANNDRVEAAGVEQLPVIGVEAGDAVAGAERLAHRAARLRERDEAEPIAERRQVREVLGLRDEAAADHPDADRHARIPRATFSNPRASSSTSASSRSGERST